jgi:CheY-like chemotaxis protein
VTAVHSGREAVDALATGTYDIVLMDVQMPDLSGFEATALIRERERMDGGHIRIVAMTAHAMTGDRERCLSAGMDGYLAKPIEPRMLFSVVEAEVQAAPAPAAATAAPDTSIVDREGALRHMGGDEQLLADVIRLFLEDCPVRLAAIKSAVASRDADAIRAEAHALKGAAGNLSAAALFEAARTLERLGAESRIDAAEGAWRALVGTATDVLDELREMQRRLPAS